MRTTRLLAVGIVTAMVAAACQDVPVTGPREATPPPTATTITPLDTLFARAASEFGVPASLLKAIGFVETRWQMVEGQEEFPGVAPAFGLMGLRGERLERGAALAGLDADVVRTDPEANIRAAAALLSSYADQFGIDRGDLGAWAPVVALYSGIDSEAGRQSYVHNDVYDALRDGAVAISPKGPLATLMPIRVEPDYPATQIGIQAVAPDYPYGIWRPSPNYNNRPAGDIGIAHMVIIHTCEGAYSGCWSWLTNPSSGVSAHYVVKEDGSEISQLVRETHRAWHIAATYDCSLNGGHDCWRNGYSSNHFTIGIEHGGYASQSSWPTSQIDASARLVCDITRDRSIPRDKYHILGHAQLQPYNRTDPGRNWPWTDYYNRINSHCQGSTIIVDSNNSNNNQSQARMEVSSTWVSASSTPGYYGSGYYWASTQAISDPATFWFYLPAAATKTVDAWWTSGANRSPNAPFIAWNASGTKLGTVYVNQQANGGKWNTLGTWNFSAGWNKIQLSRWTTEGYVVIADAVRIR